MKQAAGTMTSDTMNITRCTTMLVVIALGSRLKAACVRLTVLCRSASHSESSTHPRTAPVRLSVSSSVRTMVGSSRRVCVFCFCFWVLVFSEFFFFRLSFSFCFFREARLVSREDEEGARLTVKESGGEKE